MKFNLFIENHRVYWVLSDGSQLIKSPLFRTINEAAREIERFTNLMKSPVFVDLMPLGISPDKESATVVIARDKDCWGWMLYTPVNGQLFEVERHFSSHFKVSDDARNDARIFCNSIVDAPVLDQADVKIPALWFSSEFAKEHNIGDIHPSGKWLE
ncbi:hypothetical protein [Escherichia coli]|uniref:hypothetical protein n=1 Tax=Escherichia coli TaxID=562 RepID=UPI000BB7C8F2|nr:hypothetical protein [Escherichia coli]EFD1060832.1 hypothetical protein [Escherichia coli]CAD5721023.1 Uncharacterised protein [Escherichia coli]CAD5729766.1 Uncharacterised protein [Escherichia coli]CAD5733391.1 Uncharacterised protein [Escherichia coli]